MFQLISHGSQYEVIAFGVPTSHQCQLHLIHDFYIPVVDLESYVVGISLQQLLLVFITDRRVKQLFVAA